MRRTILMTLIAAVLAALAVSAVSLATGGDDETTADRPARASTAGLLAAAGGGASATPDAAGVLRSLAERLGVTEAELRDAVHSAVPGQARAALDRAVGDGVLTESERDLAVRCAEDRASCDRERARAVAERLHERVERDGLAGLGLGELRDGLAAAVADRLPDTSAGEVRDATRAELDETLTGLREAGFVTQRAQDLVLGCFDDPDGCDVRELERELPFLQGLGGGLGHRG